MRGVKSLVACGLALFLVVMMVSMAEAGYWKFMGIVGQKEGTVATAYQAKWQINGNTLALWNYENSTNRLCEHAQWSWSDLPEVLIPGQSFTFSVELKKKTFYCEANGWGRPTLQIGFHGDTNYDTALERHSNVVYIQSGSVDPAYLTKGVIKVTPSQGSTDKNSYWGHFFRVGFSLGSYCAGGSGEWGEKGCHIYTYEWFEGNPSNAGRGGIKNKTRHQDIQSGGIEDTILDTMNTGGVGNGPTKRTVLSISRPYQITSLMTYHWNNGRGTPSGGTVGLRATDGTMYGPWDVQTKPGQGGVPNVFWIGTPNVVIPPGSYTVIDSNPATWSQNGQSGGRGMSEIKGRAQ